MLINTALFPRYDINCHRREQLVFPLLQKPSQPARIPTSSPFLVLPPELGPICSHCLVTRTVPEQPPLQLSWSSGAEARTCPELGRKAEWFNATGTPQDELCDGAESRSGDSTAVSQSCQTAQFALMRCSTTQCKAWSGYMAFSLTL